MSLSIAIYLLIFFAVLILSDFLVRRFFAARSRDSDVNFRLQLLRESGNQQSSYAELLKKRRLSTEKKFTFSESWISKVYTQSGLTLNGFRLTLYLVAIIILSWVICSFFFSGLILPLIGTVILAPLIVILLLLRIRRNRMIKFTHQLATGLDIMIRSLRAGHPVPRAIGLVSTEMPDPIGSEYGILSDELTYGTELEDALINMLHRVGSEEIKLLAISLSVQKGTGGNLAEILENLAKVIRERGIMKAKIKAISAEGRITAFIMSLFPFFLYFMIKTLVPDYFEPLWETGYGPVVVWTCAGFMTAGVIILYRLVKFDF